MHSSPMGYRFFFSKPPSSTVIMLTVNQVVQVTQSYLSEKGFGNVNVSLLSLTSHHPSTLSHGQSHAKRVVACIHTCRIQVSQSIWQKSQTHLQHLLPLSPCLISPISMALVPFMSLIRFAINWACSMATIMPDQGSSIVLCNEKHQYSSPYMAK